MRIAVDNFKGELPRIAPRSLPEGFATQAVNCRLLSTDLEPWKNFALTEALCKAGVVNTIYPMHDPQDAATIFWLHWTDDELTGDAVQVDVASSTVAGDQTARVYFTGTDIPRFTNKSLATSGSGCMPVDSRPLGVINPDTAPTVDAAVAPNPPINIVDNFDTPASNWTFVPEATTAHAIRKAEQRATGGNPDGCIAFTGQEQVTSGLGPAYAYRDCQIGNSAAVSIEFDYKLENPQGPSGWTNYAPFNVYVMCDQNGNGPRLGWEPTEPAGTYQMAQYTGSTWGGVNTSISTVPVTGLPPNGSWVHVTITASKTANNLYTMRLLVELGSGSPLFDHTFTNVPIQGGFVGCSIPWSLDEAQGTIRSAIDNFAVQGSAPAADTSDDVSTNYVYTFVADNDDGTFSESGPSPASVTITRDNGTTVTVTTPTATPSGIDYFVTLKRIYRSITGVSGTQFFLLDEIPLSQADFIDTITDAVAAQGAVLPSAGWALPPANMRGILALPNNIYAGHHDNVLDLSVQGQPHAWPLAFRQATDRKIVGIGAIDTSVVICTEGFPYMAAGNTPDAYSMLKIEFPQSCSSARSICYLRGVGVLYASPDGMVSIAGPGAAELITVGIFTREEWQAFNPSSMICTAHDNRVFVQWETATDSGAFMLETTQNGFGKVTLAFHATAMKSDLLSDGLYMVLDSNEPPGVDPVIIETPIPLIALLHLDGANGSNTFTDLAGGTYSGNGGAVLSTAQKKFGTASLKLDAASNQYIISLNSAFYDIFSSLGDWTIEAWFYCNAGTASGNRPVMELGSGNFSRFGIGVFNSKVYAYHNTGSGTNGIHILGTTTVTEQVWHHIALVRLNGVQYLYLDGVFQGSSTNNNFPGGSSLSLSIGSTAHDTAPHQYFDGYIDDFRVTLDARYTVGDGDFTPAGPLTAFDTEVITDGVIANGRSIYQFDAAVGSPTREARLPYSYLSKLFLLRKPTTFRYARFEADDYEDITLALFDTGVQFFEAAVISTEEIPIPDVPNKRGAEQFQFQIRGTSHVRSFQIVEAADELT